MGIPKFLAGQRIVTIAFAIITLFFVGIWMLFMDYLIYGIILIVIGILGLLVFKNFKNIYYKRAEYVEQKASNWFWVGVITFTLITRIFLTNNWIYVVIAGLIGGFLIIIIEKLIKKL